MLEGPSTCLTNDCASKVVTGLFIYTVLDIKNEPCKYIDMCWVCMSTIVFRNFQHVVR